MGDMYLREAVEVRECQQERARHVVHRQTSSKKNKKKNLDIYHPRVV